METFFDRHTFYMMKTLDKVTNRRKIRKAFSSPETCPWEQKAFLFMVREV